MLATSSSHIIVARLGFGEAGFQTLAAVDKRMNAVRRGYFSEEEESNESSTIASTRMSLVPAPRSLPAPTPQELPQRASGWLAQEPGLFMWDRECIGHAVVKAVDVAPTVLVTETVVISLQNSADGVLGSLARSTRVGTLVDLAEVPSTARHARHMVVLHSDKSVATALGTYASEVEVELRNGHGPSSDQPRPGAVRLRYGPAPGQAHRYTLRVRLEASLPKLSARCSVLRRPPRLAKTRLAAELLRDGGRDLNARFGYVALDESRRAVVLLEDDPVTQSVPLVGAWVSGLIATGRTDACAEPAVLEACASFFSRKDTWCVEPQTALLVLFASRGGPAHDVICVEATAILADRNQGAADRQVVDYVADLVDPSLSEQEDKSKRPRAVLAARLLPRDLSELPLEPPPPTSPAPDVLTAVSEPQDDAADRYSLEAQLNELRRRLDELEAKSAMPTTARREIATETTSTLLMQQKPAAKITTAQQTDEVTTPPSTPACPPNTRSNDSPMPIAPLPVETHSRTDDDHLETLTADATDLQPRVDDDELPGEHRRDAHSLNLAAACHVRQPNICRDLASNETMSLATMPNAETIDLPRIVCPRDVQDLLYQAEDDYFGYEDMSAPSGDAIFSARRDVCYHACPQTNCLSPLRYSPPAQASPLIDIDTQLGHSYSEGWTTSLLVDPNLEGEGERGEVTLIK